MKNKISTIIVTICILALLLTSCTGSGTTASSWGGAIVADSAVYFANGTQVYSLRLDNGATNWVYPAKVSATRLFLAAPVLAGDQLLLGDYTNLLTSLDSRDGTTENWVFNKAKGKYIDSPLVVGEIIVAPNADNNLYALDLDGKLKWTFAAEGALWAQPASDGELVFVPSMDHYLYAVDLNTGLEKWKIDLKASLVARPTLVDGIIYTGNLDGDVFAVDSKKGELLWGPVKVGGGVWAAPNLVDGKLFFGDQTGDINILKAEDGSIVKTINTESAVLGSGVVLPEGIAFGKENGDLVLIGFDGSESWTRTVGGSLYSNLSINGDLFVVVSNKGENPLVAFDLKGANSWDFTTPKK